MTYSKVAPGDRAPTFTLPDHEGRPVSLEQFRGRRVVLYFYPKDGTAGCTIEACEFRDHLPRFKRGKAVVLGVSPDSVRSHARFHAKQGLNFPLLSDVGAEVLSTYGAWQQKQLYGHKYMGAMRTTYVIAADGTVERVWENSPHEGHAAEVWAYLRGAEAAGVGRAVKKK